MPLPLDTEEEKSESDSLAFVRAEVGCERRQTQKKTWRLGFGSTSDFNECLTWDSRFRLANAHANLIRSKQLGRLPCQLWTSARLFGRAAIFPGLPRCLFFFWVCVCVTSGNPEEEQAETGSAVDSRPCQVSFWEMMEWGRESQESGSIKRDLGMVFLVSKLAASSLLLKVCSRDTKVGWRWWLLCKCIGWPRWWKGNEPNWPFMFVYLNQKVKSYFNCPVTVMYWQPWWAGISVEGMCRLGLYSSSCWCCKSLPDNCMSFVFLCYRNRERKSFMPCMCNATN